MSDINVTPWFGGAQIAVQTLAETERVAYSWSKPAGAPEDAPKTIDDLIVWHDCDHNLWLNDDPRNDDRDKTMVAEHNGWHPTGVGHHDLITVAPLHIEASVYWPDCCGMHGWIRDGRWIAA